MRLHRYLASLVLMAALAAPLAMWSSPRDDDDRREKHSRYYDRDHHDYHQWNDSESRNYERWEREEHREHREFDRLKAKEKNKYWAWRHRHFDNDDRH